MLKTIATLALIALLSPVLKAQSDAPTPKHEVAKFSASAALLAASSVATSLAQHNGAKQCIAEDNRNGVGRFFNTSKAYGLRPNDKRVVMTGTAILSVSTILELTHHRTLAKRILLFAGATQFGVAGATQYAGCN